MKRLKPTNNLLLDTGPLIAIISKNDQHHKVCTAFLAKYKGDLLTTEPVLTETIYLLRRISGATQTIVELILRGPIKLFPFTEERLLRTAALMKQYADVPMDFADASLVTLGEELGIDCIFTLDSDFSIYRMSKDKVFHVFPEQKQT